MGLVGVRLTVQLGWGAEWMVVAVRTTVGVWLCDAMERETDKQ